MRIVEREEEVEEQMERAIIALERSDWMDERQVATLKVTQQNWEDYAKSQADFAAAEFDGGSMAPLVFSRELESVMISRTGELKRMLNEMSERYGG